MWPDPMAGPTSTPPAETVAQQRLSRQLDELREVVAMQNQHIQLLLQSSASPPMMTGGLLGGSSRMAASSPAVTG